MHEFYIQNNKTVTKLYLLSQGFPEDENVLKTINIFPINYNYPIYDKNTETIIADGEPYRVDDEYYQDFLIEQLSEKELEENLTKLSEEKRTEILQASDAAMNDYMKLFSEVEKTTWYKQEAEINAYNLDNTAPTPMLDALATVRGIDRETMLAKTNVKVELFKNLAVNIIGYQQANEDKLKMILNSNKSTIEKINEIRNFNISGEVL